MTYISTCLADGAVALFSFGDAVTPTCVDSAGIQNSAYVNVGAVTLGQTGLPGGGGAKAARFGLGGGTPGGINTPDIAAQHVGNTFTLEVWVKLLSMPSGFFGLIDGGTNQSPYMRLNPTGHIDILTKSTADIGLSAGVITNDGAFHQLVWAKAAAVNNLYIDGAVSNGTLTNATAINSVGWFFAAQDGGMDGFAAMMAVYPTALSPAKIASHYALGNTLPNVIAKSQYKGGQNEGISMETMGRVTHPSLAEGVPVGGGAEGTLTQTGSPSGVLGTGDNDDLYTPPAEAV